MPEGGHERQDPAKTLLDLASHAQARTLLDVASHARPPLQDPAKTWAVWTLLDLAKRMRSCLSCAPFAVGDAVETRIFE